MKSYIVPQWFEPARYVVIGMFVGGIGLAFQLGGPVCWTIFALGLIGVLWISTITHLAAGGIKVLWPLKKVPPPPPPQILIPPTEGDHWRECHCRCHQENRSEGDPLVMHCAPCCGTCPWCDKRITGVLDEHIKDAHPDKVGQTPPLIKTFEESLRRSSYVT